MSEPTTHALHGSDGFTTKIIKFSSFAGERIITLSSDRGGLKGLVWSKSQALALASLIQTHMGDTEDE